MTDRLRAQTHTEQFIAQGPELIGIQGVPTFSFADGLAVTRAVYEDVRGEPRPSGIPLHCFVRTVDARTLVEGANADSAHDGLDHARAIGEEVFGACSQRRGVPNFTGHTIDERDPSTGRRYWRLLDGGLMFDLGPSEDEGYTPPLWGDVVARYGTVDKKVAEYLTRAAVELRIDVHELFRYIDPMPVFSWARELQDIQTRQQVASALSGLLLDKGFTPPDNGFTVINLDRAPKSAGSVAS